MLKQIVAINLYSLSANITKWSNKLKQFVSNLPTNCLSMFDLFVGLALKGLMLNVLILLIHFLYWVGETQSSSFNVL